MHQRSNLYKDASGNVVVGKFIYQSKGRYMAQCRYPEGHQKSVLLYTFEEANEWIKTNWEKYLPGWYHDNDGRVIDMKIHRPLKARMF
jgi:hypothetical protein